MDHFHSGRNQWYSILQGRFPTYNIVQLYRVSSESERYGPGKPGSKYTDYYYYASEDCFQAFYYDPDGIEHLDQIHSSTLRSDGQSFLHLEWKGLNADQIEYWGNCFWWEKEKDGKMVKYWIHVDEWPRTDQQQEEQAYSSSDDCCCTVM